MPSEWLVDVFREHGVTRPIHVIPGGVNPSAYPLVPHSPRSARPYTFMAFADRGGRKGVDAVMRAFVKAFSPVTEEEFAAAWDAGDRPPDLRLPDDVALVMKVRPDNARTKMMNTSDPHIRFLAYDAPHMSQVYPLADCVVIPSKGEGWGFFGREAACMGVPVIASDWTGHAPDAPYWATVALENSKLTPSVDESLMLFHEPDTNELVAAMRWCYEHRAEARQKAAAGAQWLRDHQTWQHSANALLTLLTEYL